MPESRIICRKFLFDLRLAGEHWNFHIICPLSGHQDSRTLAREEFNWPINMVNQPGMIVAASGGKVAETRKLPIRLIKLLRNQPISALTD